MERLIIDGNRRLNGEIRVQGAKNAVLPIMAACILSSGKCQLLNCPKLSDVSVAADILRTLGCDVWIYDDKIVVDSSNADKHIIPCELMDKMRSSVMFSGAIVSRFKKAVITQPGGCDLGSRPIDMHIKSLKKLGVNVIETDDVIYCNCDKIKPAYILLDFPSVGTTENIMLTAAVSDGTTVIKNAAKEPEIVDLQNFINSMGGSISGAGTDCIVIEGVKKLHATTYKIMPDRIVCITYLAATAVCGGEVCVYDCVCEHVDSVCDVLEKCGCKVYKSRNKISILSSGNLKSVPLLETCVYPGFPTDAQPLIAVCLACADGKSVIRENIFSERFRYCSQLNKMGADVTIKGDCAYINGVYGLNGNIVTAMELRGGAALVTAGLKAEGETNILNVNYIDRGYEKIEEAFSKLGAKIRRVADEGKKEK